jgi:hypothetical protein
MTFEDAGRALDREFEKLRKYIREEIRPETKKEAADFLRKSAARMSRLAQRLDREHKS